jgi:hypothetical protein
VSLATGSPGRGQHQGYFGGKENIVRRFTIRKCGQAFAAAMLAVMGCSVRSDLTAVSSKNVNLANVRIDRSKSKGRVKGADCPHIIVLIPTGGPPTLDEALDRALEPAGANVLVDAVTTFESWYIPYVYGRSCWTAEGDAYDTYDN